MNYSPINIFRRVTGNVSKKTTYLVTGGVLEDGRAVDQSSKYKKAEDIGVRILSESEFDDFLYKSNRLFIGGS